MYHQICDYKMTSIYVELCEYVYIRVYIVIQILNEINESNL